MSFGHARFDLQCVLLHVLNDFIAVAVWAFLHDHSPASTTLVARSLGLREHAREYLLLGQLDTRSSTSATGVDVAIRRGAGTSAVVTEDMFFQ